MRTGKKYAVGTRHETKNCGWLEVEEYLDVERRWVRFTTTGYRTEAWIYAIRQGSIKDPYTPSVLGAGFLGEPINHPMRKVLELRWRKMLDRVHVIKTGKTISPEWYCFANFLRDAIELEGFHLLQGHSKDNRIDLDSDILAREKGLPPMYSKDTCKWVTHDENMQSRVSPKHLTRYPIGSVFQTNDGPVTLIDKDNRKWLIEFDDGSSKWAYIADVHRGQVRRPKAD